MKNNMKKILLWILSGIFVFSFVFVPVGFNFAKAQTNGLDIVLAIDSSGSMVETDPNNLRITAARIFIDLSSPSDRIGEIDFDESVKILSNLTFVKDKYVKEKFKKNLNEINSNGDTDFLKAFRAAESTFNRLPLSGRRKILVFLTDGEPHPSSRIDKDPSYRKKYMTSLYEEIDTLKKKGIEVYSIGLSKYADMDLLREISKNTNGAYFNASKASDLNVIFTEILRNLKNENIKSINPGDNVFKISPLVKEMDVLSTRSDPSSFIYLDSPDNDIITPKTPNIYYSEGKYYQLYMIPSVQSGEWKLKGNNYSNVTIWVLEKMKVILDIISPSENTTILPGKPINIDVKVIGRSPGEDLSKINPSELSMTVEIVPTNKNYTSRTISLNQVGSSDNYLSQFKGTWEKPLPGSDYWLNFVLTYKGENILTKKIIVYGPPNVPTLDLKEPLDNSVVPLDGNVKIVAEAKNIASKAKITECKALITDSVGKTYAVALNLANGKFVGYFKGNTEADSYTIGLKAVALLQTKNGKYINYDISMPNLVHLTMPFISVKAVKNDIRLNKDLFAYVPINYLSSLSVNSKITLFSQSQDFGVTPVEITIPYGNNKKGQVQFSIHLRNKSLMHYFKTVNKNLEITVKSENPNIKLKGSPLLLNITIPSIFGIYMFWILGILLILLALFILWLIKWSKTLTVWGRIVDDKDENNKIVLSNRPLFQSLFSKNSRVVSINGNVLKFTTVNRSKNEFNDEDYEEFSSKWVTNVTVLRGKIFVNSSPFVVGQKVDLADGDTLEIGNKTYTFYYYGN